MPVPAHWRTIPRIAAIVRTERVAVPHTNDAHYAFDESGATWIAKREADMGCEALLAEAATWHLARLVGVPVPDAAFCPHRAERAWLSARLSPTKHWSVDQLPLVANARQAAAILALDAVTHNEARHGGNLLLVPAADGVGLTVVAIDADEALIGHLDDARLRAMVAPDPRILARGFPGRAWQADAEAAAILLAQLPRDTLVAIAADACDVARETRVAELLDLLCWRCARAVELTRAYINRIEARP